ncbi:hypothetical protein [Streptomyces sp. NPDC058572]|uniref:hypothetical protein n=1 Tax=Streptomyces sp. NPDC058572 TaxID=3346546 RepID=UPI00365B0402
MVSQFRRSGIIGGWVLTTVIVGSVVNIASGLVPIPDGAEWWALLACAVILAFAATVHFRHAREQERQREREREREQERQREREQERLAREEQERAAQREMEIKRLSIGLLIPVTSRSKFSRTPSNMDRVKDSLRLVNGEFYDACVQFGVATPWWSGAKKTANALAEKTGDARWMIVGVNLARLRLVVRISGEEGDPVDRAAVAFEANAGCLVDQIISLRRAV